MLKAEERSLRRSDFDHMSLYCFDEELHEKALRHEGYEEGYKEGFEEGSRKAREVSVRKAVRILKKNGFSEEDIAHGLLGLFPDHADSIKRILESL